MHDSQKLQDFIDNTYYNRQLLDSGQFYQAARKYQEQAFALYDWLEQHYDVERFAAMNEANLEKEFLFPFYEQLGFSSTVQDGLSYQAKQHKLDALLFGSKEEKLRYEQARAKHGADAIFKEPPKLIAEHKQWSAAIDTQRVQGNPHHQLTQYLSTYRIQLGILTNGRYWRFYNVENPTANKVYYQIDLAYLLGRVPEPPSLLQLTETLPQTLLKEYFLYFYAVFSAPAIFQKYDYEHFVEGKRKTEALSLQQELQQHNQSEQEEARQNLRELIYSADHSIVETVGQALHRKHPDENADELFQQSVVFALRILFIAYFEQKHWQLLQQHEHYGKMSLYSIAEDLILKKAEEQQKAFIDFRELCEYLAEGNKRRKIPLFNGGLFEIAKAPLLDSDELLDKQSFCRILQKLYGYEEGMPRVPMNLSTLQVQDLGEIYESLLDYHFRLNGSHVLHYACYIEEGREVESYLDTADFATLQDKIQVEQNKAETKPKNNKARLVLLEHQEIGKHTLYLTNGSMQRKQTASYYTPQELSQPLVEKALQDALEQLQQAGANSDGVALLGLRVLDNACGSGHFLVDFLDALTRHVQDNIEQYSGLQAALAEEKQHIQEHVEQYIDDYKVDELLVLKRLLLKKVIYGVDSNPLAVELCCLALWLETFIFGTPLSFIEHHIKCGNALMGADIASLAELLEVGKSKDLGLWGSAISQQLGKLQTAYDRLKQINDTTAEQVKQSHEFYAQAQGEIVHLRRLLDISCCHHWQQGLDADKLNSSFIDKLSTVTDNSDNHEQVAGQFAKSVINLKHHLEDWLKATQGDNYLFDNEQLDKFSQHYRFFHYQLEFPDAFNRSEGKDGFHIIIGNPPWDKVKHNDEDFFSQYLSNYRQLTKGQKNARAETLRLDPLLDKAYCESQLTAKRLSAFYKHRYPLNRGSGDSNLFRLFIEKNLNLLTLGASLNYLTPSAWSYEEGSADLRKKIFASYRLRFFYQFENRKNLFPAIDNRMKFVLFQLSNERPAQGDEINCRFMLHRAHELQDPDKKLAYPLHVIAQMDSQQQSMLELKDDQSLQIVQKLYATGQALEPTYLDFYRELDMTMDSNLFVEGVSPTLSDQDGVNYLPLYQGQHIQQYKHCFARPFTYHLSSGALAQRLGPKEINRMAKALGNAAGLKKLGLSKEKLQSYHRFNYQQPRLAFRDIARNTDERSLIMALLPANCSAGNTLWLSLPYTYTADSGKGQVQCYAQPLSKLLFVQSLANSLALDFVARLLIDIHVNKTYFMRLPFVQPPPQELEQEANYRQMIGRAACLNLLHDKDGQLAHSCPQLSELQNWYTGRFTQQGPASSEPARRKQEIRLLAEQELAVAKIYRLNQQDMHSILANFPGMRKKQADYVALLEEVLKEG